MHTITKQEAESLVRLSNRIAEIFRDERIWDTARVCALLSAKSVAWMIDDLRDRDQMLEAIFEFMREHCNRYDSEAAFHTEH
jgi:hypothetical protein